MFQMVRHKKSAWCKYFIVDLWTFDLNTHDIEQRFDAEYLYDQSVVLTYGPAMWPFMKKNIQSYF